MYQGISIKLKIAIFRKKKFQFDHQSQDIMIELKKKFYFDSCTQGPYLGTESKIQILTKGLTTKVYGINFSKNDLKIISVFFTFEQINEFKSLIGNGQEGEFIKICIKLRLIEKKLLFLTNSKHVESPFSFFFLTNAKL